MTTTAVEGGQPGVRASCGRCDYVTWADTLLQAEQLLDDHTCPGRDE